MYASTALRKFDPFGSGRRVHSGSSVYATGSGASCDTVESVTPCAVLMLRCEQYVAPRAYSALRCGLWTAVSGGLSCATKTAVAFRFAQ